MLGKLLDALKPVRFDEPAVALDLETSGLDPDSDRILAIAAVPIDGQRVILHQRFERLIRDQGPVNPEAIRHHRLRPADVCDGVELAQALPALVAWMDGRPMIGFATRFDRAFLRRAARPLGLDLPSRYADVREIQQRRDAQREPETARRKSFEQIAEALGVPVVGRHQALGDAVTTALMWIALGQRTRR